MDTKIKKIKALSIDKEKNIIDALKLMDKIDKKLLIVTDSGVFCGLLSIGDIQRAIIANIPIETNISKILRKKIRYASINDDINYIKKLMIQHRIEFMPLLDSANKLSSIIFWDEIFDEKYPKNKKMYNLPVVVMAGGKGTRLKPFSTIFPKALFPIGDHTILSLIINNFKEFGSKKFYISVNYKSNLLKAYISNFDHNELDIEFIEEDKPLGTAGSLAFLNNKIYGNFILSNCDILIYNDYSEIYEYHNSNQNSITIVSSIRNYKIPYGVVKSSEGGKLISIDEKPEYNFAVNTGLYIINQDVFKYIPPDTYLDMNQLIENVQKANMNIGVYPVSENSWMDIGEWNEYKRTLDIVNQKYTPSK